jgi:hypothetical protein
VTPKSGFKVGFAATPAGQWYDEDAPMRLSYDDTQTGAQTFYVLDVATGRISQPVLANWKVDTVNPSGALTMRGNVFTQLLNVITFGYFFKNTVDVTVTGQDTLSGVDTAETRWYKHESATPLDPDSTDWGQLGWTKGNMASIAANFKGVVYARVYDKAGNSTVVSSDGLVIYLDAQAETAGVEYTKTTKTDTAFALALNGNTIKDVKIGSDVISSPNEYEYSGGNLTLKGAYLDTLDAGDYTVEVTVNPYGNVFVAENGADGDAEGADENDAPAAVAVTLRVSKMAIAGEQIAEAVTGVSATPLVYGKRLSASTPSAAVKSPADPSTVAGGDVAWKDASVIPGNDEQSALNGLKSDGYAFTAVWTPSDVIGSYGSGKKASDYFEPIEFPVTVSVSPAVPYMEEDDPSTANLHEDRPVGTPILMTPYETLADSKLSGQVFYDFAGNAVAGSNPNGETALGGAWHWDEDVDGVPDANPKSSTINSTSGVKAVGAVFVPIDPRIASYHADVDPASSTTPAAGHGLMASLSVISPTTDIVIPDDYSVTGTRGLTLASIPASGTLNDYLWAQGFRAVESDGNPEDDAFAPYIPGTFTWKSPGVVLSAAGKVQTAVVLFTPTSLLTQAELAGGDYTPDPAHPKYVAAEFEIAVTLESPQLVGQANWTADSHAYYEGTLTVDTSGLSTSPDVSATIGTGAFHYSWKRYSGASDTTGVVIAGADGASYTLTPQDIGWQIAATVTAENTAGARTTARTEAVAPKPQAAPAQPVLADKTSNTITVQAIPGAEYSIDYGAKGDAAHWQDVPAFTRAWQADDVDDDLLKPNTTYAVYARIKAVGANPVLLAPSPASPALSVTTNRAVTYGATQKGGANATATSTGVRLTFGVAVPDLKQTNILALGDGVSVTAGSLKAVSGSGDKVWEFDVTGSFDNGTPLHVTVHGLADADILTLPTETAATATLYRDVTAPTLTSGTVDRTSDTTATIGFTADEAGAAYALVLAKGADAPNGSNVIAQGASLGTVPAGATADLDIQLTTGARDIYVCVKDAAGNVSTPLLIAAGKNAASLSQAPAAHTGLVYTGAPLVLVEEGYATGGTLQYAVVAQGAAMPAPGAFANVLPTAVGAGTYDVYYMLKGDAGHADVLKAEWKVTVVIAKAVAAVKSAPQDEGRTYSGAAQRLVTPGDTEDGTLLYALLAGAGAAVPVSSAFKEAVPTAVNAGQYTVWYYVKGDANHEDSAPVAVAATVKKAPQAVLKLGGTMPLRDGEKRTMKVSGGSGTGAYTLAYAADASTNPAVATVAPMAGAPGSFEVVVQGHEGEYALVYGRAGDANYLDAEQQSTMHDVGKSDAAITVDAKAVTGLVYDGAAHALVTPGDGNQLGMAYRLGEEGEWQTAIPTGVNAGAYDVFFKAVGDPDHNDSMEDVVTVTIAKAGQAAVTLSGDLPEAQGETQTLTVGGGSGTGAYTLSSMNPDVVSVAAVNAAAGTFAVTVAADASDVDYGLEYGREGDGNHLPISAITPAHHVTKKPDVPVMDEDAPAKVDAIHTALSKYGVVKGRSLTIPIVVALEAGETKAPVLTWESSKPKVAKVTKLTKTSVKVKGLKAGKTKITVRADNGKKLTFTVTVSKKKVKLSKLSTKKTKTVTSRDVSVTKSTKTSAKKKPSVGMITVYTPAESMKVGQTEKLKITVSSTPPTHDVPKFKSSKKSVITIDKAGYMTAHKKGKATITVKVGGKKVKVTVKVK